MTLSSNRFPARFLLAALFLTLLPLGCRSEAKDEDESHPAIVVVERAKSGQDLEQWTELVGITQPLPQKVARITTSVEGNVKWVLGADSPDKKAPRSSAENNKPTPVREGQFVTQGTVIVQLDDSVFKANMARGEANLGKLKNQQEQAANAVEVAKIKVRRLGKVQARDLAEGEMEEAKLAVKDAQLKKQAADKDLVVAQAELAALKVQLAYFTLKAPIDGKLGRVEVARGQNLAIGTRVADVLDLRQKIDVLCYVPPASIGRIEVGQPAEIVEDAADEKKPLQGTVEFKDDQAQADTGNFMVKVRFDNDKRKLSANAVLRVRVRTLVKKNADTIPEQAVLEDQDKPVVVVVREVENKDTKKKEQQAFRVEVKLGLRDRPGKRIEILELDLEHSKAKSAAERRKEVQAAQYVIEGGHGLQDEDEVKLKEPEKAEKEKE